MNDKNTGSDENFFPKGAVVFFFLMIAFFAAIWAGIYQMMVGRH